MTCAGVALVGLDGTLYDQVLDFIFYLGLAPARFSVRPLYLLPTCGCSPRRHDVMQHLHALLKVTVLHAVW